MKKNDGLTDALNDLMGNPGQGQSPEPSLRMEMKQRKENMKQHNFRMKQSEWNRLKIHFHEKGVSIAGGLRMVLLDYMRVKRI